MIISPPATADSQAGRRTETAAQHLLTHVPRAAAHETSSAVRARLAGARYHALDAVYVIDDSARLIGLVPLTELMAAAPDQPLAEIMNTSPPRVLPDRDQEHVATTALLAGVSAVPVVDGHERLLGVVPAGSLIEILRREHIEDMQRLVGIHQHASQASHALEAAPHVRARERLPWLLVGLLGSVFATYVMTRFEAALATQLAIAFFVPGIVYLADAVGTQSEAIAVRGLSFNHTSLARLVGGELVTGLLIGLALAAAALPLIWLVFGDLRLALAVAAAIVTAGAAATSIGLLLPWLLSRFGIDPALGSGPVATILQDVFSLLVYFGFVTLLLL
jgi:magnesium transporter